MAQPILKSIPLSELRISKLNMRHSRKKPDVSDILPSIRESGIRQTLLVRKEGDHYGVVAGRRRGRPKLHFFIPRGKKTYDFFSLP